MSIGIAEKSFNRLGWRKQGVDDKHIRSGTDSDRSCSTSQLRTLQGRFPGIYSISGPGRHYHRKMKGPVLNLISLTPIAALCCAMCAEAAFYKAFRMPIGSCL